MLHITLTEPVSPRYIYINPETNQVHLLVPLAQGQEISTDNTCQSGAALYEFKSAALNELYTYKAALEFDLQYLKDDEPALKALKEARLIQINAYINAFPAMNDKKYLSAIASMMSQTRSNLYSIQLRPCMPDIKSKVVNPVFSIKRTIDETGTPQSALYNAMHEAYPQLTIAPLDPKSQLDAAVLKTLLGVSVPFTAIQAEMTTQCQRLFGLAVDFTKIGHSTPVSKAYIDKLMRFSPEPPATTQEYIDALWNACAPNIGVNIATKPFYSVRDKQELVQTEKLSILTQFFLAHVNIYCKARGIGDKNFGVILDASPKLSRELVAIVSSALIKGSPVEERVCTFVNEHAQEFGLAQSLTATDMKAIQDKFERTYKTVTSTKENPDMDDFMILDTDAREGQFVTHQGSICTDFANLIDQSLDNALFQMVRRDFEAPSERLIPNKNEHIQASFDLDMETLLSRIKDDAQFRKLPPAIQLECLKLPAFQLRTFLHDVAKGNQNRANQLLTNNPERTQELLNSSGTFTDYSGRMFNCTAYEYAYWAKDTHMCRMLERHMSDETKADMAQRINTMESLLAATNEPVGLTYSQHGSDHHSAHFNLSALITALNEYDLGYDNWKDTSDWPAMKSAWMKVGLAQRDLPVHVINEYCRKDRSFDPCPKFKENKLPRELMFHNSNTGNEEPLFPLVISTSSGLGLNFSLVRARGKGAIRGVGTIREAIWGFNAGGAWSDEGMGGAWRCAPIVDWTAINCLDEVRTAELTQSRENLKPIWLTFLPDVAKGNQDRANQLLTDNPKKTQELLNSSGTFTDYSGRTFNCTAYEYAYWAKDTHMCRMLESYMSDETKADMARRINTIESRRAATNEPVGLTYSQHGSDHHSAHFDLSALKTALREYSQGYDNWRRTNKWTEIHAAWRKIGLAQRDVPVHVINEYCRKDRSFDPCPEFNEDKLPRELMFAHNLHAGNEEPLFPLGISTSSGLGLDFSLMRIGGARANGWGSAAQVRELPSIDLAAICRLDEVRTQDLTRSQEILGSIEPEHVHGSRP